MKAAYVLATLAAATCASAHRLSAWSNTGYTGTAYATTGTGTFPLGFTAKSYKWESTTGDGCCIKFCNGGNETGNYCPSKSNTSVAAANQFNKVTIGCGSTVLNC